MEQGRRLNLQRRYSIGFQEVRNQIEENKIEIDDQSYARDEDDEQLPKDVASGNSYFKSLTTNYKEYGMQVVNKKDGHPVRAGNQSIRFEVRPGDCGRNDNHNDCETDRERHELSGRRTMSKGEWWYAWSIYFPKDYINVYPTKTALGQFHQKKGHPVFMFDFLNFGYYVVETAREDDRLYTHNKIVKTDEIVKTNVNLELNNVKKNTNEENTNTKNKTETQFLEDLIFG